MIIKTDAFHYGNQKNSNGIFLDKEKDIWGLFAFATTHI